MMKVTRWKLITLLEMDGEGIVSIKHLSPIQVQDDWDEEDDGEEEE